MANNSLPQAADVGFAQFTVAQITETFEAVITAQLEQEQKVRKLLEAAEMDLFRFAEEFISEQEVEEELGRLFPSEQVLHSVMVDASYQPGSEGEEENPPVLEKTGYQVSGDDLEEHGQGFIITEEGYRNIFARVKMILAAEQRANIIGMANRGVPRIVVDSGRVNTKLRFQLSQREVQGGQQAAPAAGGVPAASAAPPFSSSAQLAAPVSGLKLLVKPVDLRHPEVTNLSVNVVGEVEICFKTIFD